MRFSNIEELIAFMEAPPRLQGSKYKILLLMAHGRDENWYARKLRGHLRCTDSCISNAIRDLRDLGFIEVTDNSLFPYFYGITDEGIKFISGRSAVAADTSGTPPDPPRTGGQ